MTTNIETGRRREMDRRTFLTSAAAVGGAMVVGFHLPPTRAQAAATTRVAAAPWYRDAGVPEINAWLTIGPDDIVTIRVAQTEMGNGVFTACPMMVAEELQCDWSKVRAEYASAQRSFVEPAPEWTLPVPGGNDPWNRNGAGETVNLRSGHSDQRRLPPHEHQQQRLGAREPLLPAARRRRSAGTAAARGRSNVGGANIGTGSEGQCHHACRERAAHDLWRDRRQGRPDRTTRSLADQDQGARPIHPDGDRAERSRCPAEGHRQSHLRHRCRAAGHALCGRQGLSCVRRHGQELRFQRDPKPSWHPFRRGVWRQGICERRYRGRC